MQPFYEGYQYPAMGMYMPPVPFMPIHPILARAYVPYQISQKTFSLSEALEKGTLYPELYQPYEKKNKPNVVVSNVL